MLANINTARALTRADLERVAPSVFAEHKAESRSRRYSFLPTLKIIEKLEDEGWLPTKAIEQRVRTEDRRGFQKHMLRFRRFGDQTLTVGDSVVEMILVNSHDGTSAYQLSGGLYRLVCSNGMVVSDATFETIKLKHQGFRPKDVINASYRIIEEVPAIEQQVKNFQAVTLSQPEQIAFAEAALQVRFPDKEGAQRPLTPNQVLFPRRLSDQGDSLWKTLNRVQENVTKGGMRGVTLDQNNRLRHRKIRSVNGIDQDIALNKALWTLANKINELKAA